MSLTQALPTIPAGATGLYRSRQTGAHELLYVGQGVIASRLAAHWAKQRIPEHPQGQIFAHAAPLAVSWVAQAAWLALHRLELETDLIGAHVLVREAVQAAQFLG